MMLPSYTGALLGKFYYFFSDFAMKILNQKLW